MVVLTAETCWTLNEYCINNKISGIKLVFSLLNFKLRILIAEIMLFTKLNIRLNVLPKPWTRASADGDCEGTNVTRNITIASPETKCNFTEQLKPQPNRCENLKTHFFWADLRRKWRDNGLSKCRELLVERHRRFEWPAVPLWGRKDRRYCKHWRSLLKYWGAFWRSECRTNSQC